MKMSKIVLGGSLLLVGVCLVMVAYRAIAMDGDLDGHWNEIRRLVPEAGHTTNHPHMDTVSSFKLRECWFFCRYRFQSPQSMEPHGWGYMSLFDLTPEVRRFLQRADGMPQDICNSECVFGGFVDEKFEPHVLIVDWKNPDYEKECPPGKALCAKFYMILLSRSASNDLNGKPGAPKKGDALSARHLMELFSNSSELEILHLGSAHSGGNSTSRFFGM